MGVNAVTFIRASRKPYETESNERHTEVRTQRHGTHQQRSRQVSQFPYFDSYCIITFSRPLAFILLFSFGISSLLVI
jgi:hypothetical protein